jgi:Ca2+-binding RTX toxin-like protein
MANSGFETGNFTDWATIGDASIQTAEFGTNPTEGDFQALVTSGVGSVSDAELENSLGLAPGSLDKLGKGNATEGSALQFVPITVKAGDILIFDWNFLTLEETPSFYNDFSFASITSLSKLGDTKSNFVLSNTPFLSETGYQTFSYQFASSGTYQLNLGVVDVGDTVVDSGLLIDNLQVVTPIKGTSGDDVLIGTKKNDYIMAFGGDDDIIGQAGNDTLLGGAGADLINAGNGNDRVEGGKGDNEISGGAGNDLLKASNGIDLIFGGDGNDLIRGGGNKDRLFGEGEDDTIYGEDGNDNLNGGDGFDTLYGGKGNDNLFGGNGFGQDDSLYGEDGNDRLNSGDGNDYLDGGKGRDYLFGSSGDDWLEGGNGNDTLVGASAPVGFGSQNDTLTGGLGKDIFVLGDANQIYYDDLDPTTNGDIDYALITDFNTSADKIRLKGSAELYRLDFFVSSAGTQDVAILNDLGNPAKDELIAIVENVSTNFSLNGSYFAFV